MPYKDKDVKKEFMKNYWIKNKERLKEYKRQHWKEVWKKERKEVLDHYGNMCVCCKETQEEFLTIDHIHGGGNKHKKEMKISNIYKWLIKNNFPEGFRLLCYNCNCSLGFRGYCPHGNL